MIVVASLSIKKYKLDRPEQWLAERKDTVLVDDPAQGQDLSFMWYFLNWTPIEIKQRFFAKWAEDAAWRAPFNKMPFTPTLSCEPGYSVLMNRFDWQVVPESAFLGTKEVYEHWKTSGNTSKFAGCGKVDVMPWRNDTVTMVDPKTVWAAPHAVQRLLSLAAERLDPGHSDRLVVFAGTEMPLSAAFGRDPAERAATVAALQRYFKRILYLVRDIDLDGVGVAPMGLCWGYYMSLLPRWLSNTTFDRRQLSQVFSHFETLVAVNTSIETKGGILACRAVVATWLENLERIGRNVRHYRRLGVLFPPSNSSLETVSDATESRRQMRVWAESPAARSVGVELRTIPVEEWYDELAKYRFLISPMGSAIQTSKTIEALIVLTVPIIQRMGYSLHDELVTLGFPVVIIEGWPEITADAVERWWQALSPRLEGFRRNCLSVDGFWRIFTGQAGYCT